MDKVRRLVIINEVHRFYTFTANDQDAVLLAMDTFLNSVILGFNEDRTVKKYISDITVIQTTSGSLLEKEVLYHV